jgi:hypothetical protein
MAHRSESIWKSARRLAVAIAISASFATPALADPDEASKEHARELMTKGRQARSSADLAAALSNFSAADEIMHVPTTGLEVAKTLRDMGRLVEAAAALERVEAIPENPTEPEAFSTARRAAKEMGLELDARIPSLRLTSSPVDASGTRVTLDGKAVDEKQAAGGLRVDPGRHVATAERQGVVQQRVVELAESGSADVNFDFGSGLAESAPPLPRAARASTSRYVIYGLTGLAVAGIGTGIGLAVWSNQRQSTLEERCAPRCNAEHVTDVRIGYVAANVTTAIGIASGLAALTVYFVRADRAAPKRETAGSLSVSAGMGPNVSLRGTF